jgi:hypothetical protein
MSCEYTLHREFILTGELYYQLRVAGVKANLEVHVPSSGHRSGWARVDIGCFVDDRLVAVIECKREGKEISDGRQQKMYLELYEHYGLAVFFVNRIAEVPMVVRKVVAALDILPDRGAGPSMPAGNEDALVSV